MLTFEEKIIDLGYQFINVPKSFKAIPGKYKAQEICEKASMVDQCSLGYVSDRFKIQDMCSKAVRIYPYTLWIVPDHFITQEMCFKALVLGPWQVRYVSDHFENTRNVYKSIQVDPFELNHVSDHLKMHKMYKGAVCNESCMLGYVPNCFKTRSSVRGQSRRSHVCLVMTLITLKHQKWLIRLFK